MTATTAPSPAIMVIAKQQQHKQGNNNYKGGTQKSNSGADKVKTLRKLATVIVSNSTNNIKSNIENHGNATPNTAATITATPNKHNDINTSSSNM